jgi:tRNA (cytidine/uridine-2'-O-)-methyltransferase
MLSVALFEPEIPGNAGAVARLCAGTSSSLHLIGRLGFSFRHPDARRAGMDYWEKVDVHRHVNYADFREAVAPRRVWMLSTHAEKIIWDVEFRPDDVLLFGPESRGLPSELLRADPHHALRIPLAPAARSLNLTTAVAVTLFETMRQLDLRSDRPRFIDTRSDES